MLKLSFIDDDDVSSDDDRRALIPVRELSDMDLQGKRVEEVGREEGEMERTEVEDERMEPSMGEGQEGHTEGGRETSVDPNNQ